MVLQRKRKYSSQLNYFRIFLEKYKIVIISRSDRRKIQVEKHKDRCDCLLGSKSDSVSLAQPCL